jgi:hypothetical protein
VRANRLSRFCCGGIQERKGKVRYYRVRKVFEVIYYMSVGPPPTNQLQLFFGTSCNLAVIINRAKYNFDRLSGFGWAGA